MSQLEIHTIDHDQRIRNILEALQQNKEKYPWQWFKPLPSQALFQRFVGEKFQVVLFQGGNWTGKTITGANTVAQLAYTGEIQTFDVQQVVVDGKKQYAHVKGPLIRVCDVPNYGRVVTDKELVEKDVVKNLKKQMHPSTFVSEKKGRPFDSQWYLDSRSEFDILTFDQDPKQFEGVELDWAWMNEPPTEAIFKAMLGRFKKGGTLFITATILGCAWIIDAIIDANNPRYKVVTMDIDENRESNGGYLPDAAVDDMLNSQDPEEREARKTGKALKLMGRVFKSYEEKHFVEMENTAPENALVMMATDPHDKIPCYSAWAYLDSEGRLCVYREHPDGEFWDYTDNPWADEEKMAAEYQAMEDVEPVRRLLDKKFGNTTKFGSQLTVKELLHEVGLDYEDWDGKSRAAHNKKIRTWLEQDKIRISKNCQNMDKALRRHRFLDQRSARAKDEKGQREDVDEKYRHMIDVLAGLIEAADDGIMDCNVVEFNATGRWRNAQTEEERERQKIIEATLGHGVIMPEEDDEFTESIVSLADLF